MKVPWSCRAAWRKRYRYGRNGYVLRVGQHTCGFTVLSRWKERFETLSLGRHRRLVRLLEDIVDQVSNSPL